MDFFNYSTELPFSKRIIKFRELKTREQIALAKANLSFPNNKNNHLDYYDFVLKTINNCLEESGSLNDVNIMDYVLFVTKLRIVSIGNIIELITESKNREISKVKTKLNLNEFLKNLYVSSTEALVDDIIEENEIQVKIGWPMTHSVSLFQRLLNDNKSQYQIFAESFHEFVEQITYKDVKISFLSFTTEQKITLMEKLSVSLIKKIQERVLEVLKFLMNYDLWSVSTFEGYNFNIYSLNFIDFIRLFFSYDIKSIYQEIYYMGKEGISPEYILNLSPSERKIHLSIIEESKKTEKDESSYDYNEIDKNSSSAVEDLALEFDDIPPK